MNSVVLLERADLSPAWERPSRVFPVPKRKTRASISLVVLACHVALAWLIASSTPVITRAAETERLVSVFVRPRIVGRSDPAAAMQPQRPLRVRASELLDYDSQIPDIERPAVMAMGVGTMTPYPEIEAIDPRPFARRAGLAPGKGATVVVRVEVFGTGEIGRAEIDVPGPTETVNEAALAYVRALPWVGGMVDGQPATFWIRYGVRLEQRDGTVAPE